ncbi:integrase core domain-containing protein, partial [Ancylobacter oerskovii]|nr:integrase core domain-containing protein [Ancylobacter oerskovii]
MLHRRTDPSLCPRDRPGTADHPDPEPQSNGMAEAFVRTFKRDYISVNPVPDARTVMLALPKWFDHYNELHPHRALGYRSPH